MNSEQIEEVSLSITVGLGSLSQEDAQDLSEPERLGLVVGSLYGQALQDRDRARTAALEIADALNELVEAAEVVLGMDVLDNLTWAGDEDRVARLRQAVVAARGDDAVGSIQENETQEDA